MEFARLVDFGQIPYMMPSERPLYISNSGSSSQHVLITQSEEIMVSPYSFTLQPASSVQVIVQCIPTAVGPGVTSLCIYVNYTVSEVVELRWECVYSSICVSRQFDGFAATLIQQTAQTSVTVSNTGDFPVKFGLYAGPSSAETFASDVFQISPQTGEIYPYSSVTLTARFAPQLAMAYKAFVYLQADAQAQRIPIALSGVGVAPDVQLDCDVLDFERLCIGQTSTCTMAILNASAVQIAFRFVEKDVKFGLQLSTKSGIIPAGQKIEFTVQICPYTLYDIDEMLLFEVLNTTLLLPFQVLARVVAPDVALTVDLDNPDSSLAQLSFGVVPFGFGSRREVHLYNRSGAPQQFSVRIEPSALSDAKLMSCGDFNVNPRTVQIEAGASAPIQVTLLPKQSRGAYDGFVLRVFSAQITERPLLEIPVAAQVSSARFVLEPSVFELPRAYVGYEHKFPITIRNTSNVVGRWLFPVQDNFDACVVGCSAQSGVLAPNSSQEVTISIVPRGPGNLVIPVNFLTDDRQEMQCMVQYNARGPYMLLSTESIAFPQTQVLAAAVKHIIIENNGLSDSIIHISASKAGSFFTVAQADYKFYLPAGAKRDVSVTLSANIYGNHRDNLIIIQELFNQACDISEDVVKQIINYQKVSLHGTTRGTSLFAPALDFSKPVNCGIYFTSETMRTEILIENHGPETQNLTWYAGKSSRFVFENSKMSLQPGEAGAFILTCNSDAPGVVYEQWTLKTSIPGKSTDTAFMATFECKFIDNYVKVFRDGAYAKEVRFTYQEFPVFGNPETFFGDRYAEAQQNLTENEAGGLIYKHSVIKERLTFYNLSPLPCRAYVAVHSPFSILSAENDQDGVQYQVFKLGPGYSDLDFYVQVDEEFCVGERVSSSIDSMMLVRLEPEEQLSYRPPLIKIPLHLQCCFPSVAFKACEERDVLRTQENYGYLFDSLPDGDVIDFGSLVPGTTVRRIILAKNIGLHPIQLEWSLSNVDESYYSFDISPACIFGDSGLNCDEIGVFEIVFYCKSTGKDGLKVVDCIAACGIAGGCYFCYHLHAEASNLAIDIQPSNINFGDISYISEQIGIVTIQNMSQVKANLYIAVPAECLPFIKRINEASVGKDTKPVFDFELPGNGRIEVKFVCIPRVPGFFNIPLSIKAGHLEEVLLPITGQSYIENVQLFTGEKLLARAQNIFPWQAEFQLPPYNAFAAAAYAYYREFPLKYQLHSTLIKTVLEDGTLQCYGKTIYPGEINEPIDASCYQVITELILTNVEHFVCYAGDLSRIPSRRVRSRQGFNMYFVNDNAIASLKMAKEIPKYPLLFNMLCDMPPTQRGVICEQVVRLQNISNTPLVFNIERKYLVAYGINVLPEKLPRVAHNECVELTIYFTPNAESPLGELQFVVPLFFRSSAIGFITCRCNVSVPFLKPMNLMQLAQNFIDLPIDTKDQQAFVLNFGTCYYGYSARFQLRMYNPSPLAAPYTCHVNCGVGRQYTIGSKEKISIGENFSQKLDGCFELSQTYGQVYANYDGVLTVTFRPIDWYKLEDTSLGSLFSGELKFAVRDGSDYPGTKLSVKLFGVGYHPQLKLSSRLVVIDPVFPKEISQNYTVLTVENTSDQDFEIYVKQLDVLHNVEQAVMSMVANCGEDSVFRSKDRSIVYLSDFARAGEQLSAEITELLRSNGFAYLADFFYYTYDQFVNPQLYARKDAKDDLKQEPKQEKDQKAKTAKLQDQETSQLEYKQPTRVQSMTSLAHSALKEQIDRLQEYNKAIEQHDFSYELTDLEQTQLKYSRSSATVFSGRSYRIAENDCAFSNIPFMAFIVCGPPLAGKTALCSKLYHLLAFDENVVAVTIQLKQMLAESETFKKFQEAEQQYLATIKNKKDQPPQVDFRTKAEYIEALAAEYLVRIEELVNAYSHVIIGMVFDGLDCEYTAGSDGTLDLICRILEKYKKGTLYQSQLATARLSINVIVLDQDPAITRKRKMQFIADDYNNAVAAEQELYVLEFKEQLIRAKQSYDTYNEVYLALDKTTLQTTSNETVPINYQDVIPPTDELGMAQHSFAYYRKQLSVCKARVMDFVIRMHKYLIDAEMELDQTTYEFNEVSKAIEATATELAVKKGNKQLAQKLTDLYLRKDELQAQLPEHPVNYIPSSNMFTFKYVYSDSDAIDERFILEDPLERVLAALKKYSQALQNKVKTAYILQRNQRLGLMEVFCNFSDVLTKYSVEQALQDYNSQLSRIVSGVESPESILRQIYADSKTGDVQSEMFYVFPVNQQLVTQVDEANAKIQALEEETNISQQQLKYLSKQQQNEYAAKKQYLQQYQELQKAVFTGDDAKNEIGHARWIIKRNSVQKLVFRFYSNTVKKSSVALDLQCRNHELCMPVKFECLCDWPHIVSDLTQILPKVQGTRGFKPENKVLSFGNLRAKVPVSEFFVKDLQPDDLITNAMDYDAASAVIAEKASHFINNHFYTLKLSNDSAFTANVVVFLKSYLGEATPEDYMGRLYEPVEDKKLKTEVKGYKDKTRYQEEPKTFFVFPQKLQLQPGEFKHVLISAFPQDEGEYEDTVHIGVERNPSIISFGARCRGANPVFEYVVPECYEELLPCQQLVGEVNGLCYALSPTTDPKAKTKPAAKEKSAKTFDKQYFDSLLMIPRASLKQENIVEVPFKNTSVLPIFVEFIPYTTETLQPFAKDFTVQAFSIAEEPYPKHFKQNVPPPPKVFTCTFSKVVVRNIRFLLKPGEYSSMFFVYKTNEIDQSVLPAKLQIRQFCPRHVPDECAIAKLKDVAKFYYHPLLDKNIIVLAEGHQTNIVVAVTKVELSENNVIKSPPRYSVDEPVSAVNFGICKALNHFRAEITLVNKGKYDVQFKAQVAKALQSQLTFVVCEQQQLTQTKKGYQQPPQETFVRQITQVIKAPSESEDPKAKGKVQDSSVVLFVDFFAESITDLQNAPAFSFVFSDKVTQVPLSKQTVTISARVKYAELQINPDRIMLFGDLSSGRVVTKNITVENTGHFATCVVVETLSQVLKRKMVLGCYSLFDERYAALQAYLKLEVAKLADFGVVDGGFKALAFDEQGKTPRGAKPAKAAKDARPVPYFLQIGPFYISPWQFVLRPGQKQIIQVAYSAKASTSARDYIVLDWSNKLPSHASNLLITEQNMTFIEKALVDSFAANAEVSKTYPFYSQVLHEMQSASLYKYALTGTSQIPGIDGDIQQLFEEQQIQNQPPTDPASVDDGMYSVMANQLCVGNCQLGHARKERIKFYNPFSVECNFVFIIAPVEQPVQEAIKEQIGDTIYSIQAYIEDPAKSGPKSKKPAPAASKPAKGEALTTTNDQNAWSIDARHARILPRQTTYVTIEYRPTLQSISRARFIAVSVDVHYRAKELAQPDPKGDNYRKCVAELQAEMSDVDKRNTMVHTELVGVGVLPEVLVSPAFIDLGKVLVSQSDAQADKISVKNCGRVTALYSVSIQSQTNAVQDCFELLGNVDSRLFSGLREIEAGATASYEIRPYFAKLLQLSADVTRVQASVVVHIMTSDDTYESIYIPVSFTVVTDDVCCVSDQLTGTKRLASYCDAVQFLFQMPQTVTSKQVARSLLESISECSNHKNARAQQIQAYGSLQDAVLNSSSVFLADQLWGCKGDDTAVRLVNQSAQNYAFEIDPYIQQQIGVVVTPQRGHLLAGYAVSLRIAMVQPAAVENSDPKPKKATSAINRLLLFGNPLLIRLVLIAFKNPRQTTPWTCDSAVPEPQHECLVNESMQQQLQAEWDELQSMATKKTKMTAQQQTRAAQLGKVFTNGINGINSQQLARLTNSQFIQLNLFGCIATSQVKYFTQLDDGAFDQIQAQTFDKCNQVILNFEKVAILQQAEASVYVLNDGIVSFKARFECSDEESPFIIAQQGYFVARPDLLAQAVKETFPQITDAKESQQLLQASGNSAKSQDKGYATQLYQCYSAPQNSPYVEKLQITFSPQLPGSFCCLYQDARCLEQLYLYAQAYLPICHIYCDPTPYLYRERPASFATPYLFSNLMAKNLNSVKVVEISGVGVGQRSTTTVDLVNTISEKYDIVMQRLQESSAKIATTATTYSLASGERIYIKFTYVPDNESLKCQAEEAFYILRVPKFKVEVPLLVVGKPAEPDVQLSNVKMVFGLIPFGQYRQCEVDIINNENQPYNYAIKPPKAGEKAPELKILPQYGIIPANGKTTIVVQCTPTRECSISKVISIEIARKSMPLYFNIKYDCVKVKHILELLPENEQVGIPMVVQNVMDVDFGTVFISDQKMRRLKITNSGMMDLVFQPKLELMRTITTARRDAIELKLCQQNLNIAVTDAAPNGEYYTLAPGKIAHIEVIFSPYVELSLTREFSLFMNVNVDTIGAQRLRIFAKGVKPLLKASASSINYGVVLADLVYDKCKCETLSFKNHDSYPLTLEFVSETADFFIMTPPEQKPLMQGQTRKVEIRFQPIFAQKFVGRLTVTVNGIYKLYYPLTGEAVENRIEVSQREVQLGGILTSSAPMYRKIQLSNKSAAYVRVELQFHPEMDVPDGLFLSLQTSESSGEIISKALDQLNGWNVRTNKQAYLQRLQKTVGIPPQSSADVLVFYKPCSRQAQFHIPIDVVVEECKLIEKICTISGAAIGTSARLLTNSVELPPCLQNSFVQNEFVIENTGDVALDYRIPVPPKTIIKRQLLEMFANKVITIFPAQGTIPPGETRAVVVKFAPPAGFQPGRYQFPGIPVEYTFYGTVETIGLLSVLAVCEGQDKFYYSVESEVSFACPSREYRSSTQRVENATDRIFEVKTVMQGEGAVHFQVPDRLVIQPGGTEFNIVFKPLKYGVHDAKLIIPGSEGGACVFKLHGTSETPSLDGYITNVTAPHPTSAKGDKPKSSRGKKPYEQQEQFPAPECSNVISVPELLAYTTQRISIPLRNWENVMQRFVISAEFAGEALCHLEHPDFVDLPAQGSERILDVHFVAFYYNTEYNGNIVFTNKQTGEFMRFQIKLFAGVPAPALVVQMQSTCRDTFTKNVQIANPLQHSRFQTLQLQFSCKNDCCIATPQTVRTPTRQISIPVQLAYTPRVPCKLEEFVIDVSVVADQTVALAPMRIAVYGVANAPRPSSVLKVDAAQGKITEFQLALQAKPGTYYAAFTALGDVQAVFDVLDQRTVQKGGICDKTQFFQARNGFSITAAEIATQNGQFSVQMRFQPDKMGQFATNLVVYAKGCGIWLVPIVGTCTKAPSSGIVSFE